MTDEEWLAYSEWLAYDVPTGMLEVLRSTASERKLRLFAIACCHRILHLIPDKRSKRAIELAEIVADEKVEVEILLQTARNAGDVTPMAWKMLQGNNLKANLAAARVITPFFTVELAKQIAQMEAEVLGEEAADLVSDVSAILPFDETDEEEYRQWVQEDAQRTTENNQEILQAVLLRDIFGNPYLPIALEPDWLTSTVVALAAGIYQNRAFDRMPILADAFQDAGCEHEDILNHCRGDGPHVRGCWLVDLILGKE
jgi:hypothetical protein